MKILHSYRCVAFITIVLAVSFSHANEKKTQPKILSTPPVQGIPALKQLDEKLESFTAEVMKSTVSLMAKNGSGSAGLLAGDIVIRVDNTEVSSPLDFSTMIQKRSAGDHVELDILRDEKPITFDVKLSARPAGKKSKRFEQMNQMSGEMSKRRGGFPEVLQHDIPLEPSQCGGPVIDLDGDCLGINVSRSGRIKTYAIPAEDVQELLDNVSNKK